VKSEIHEKLKQVCGEETKAFVWVKTDFRTKGKTLQSSRNQAVRTIQDNPGEGDPNSEK
jgi:hypothetical protein